MPPLPRDRVLSPCHSPQVDSPRLMLSFRALTQSTKHPMEMLISRTWREQHRLSREDVVAACLASRVCHSGTLAEISCDSCGPVLSIVVDEQAQAKSAHGTGDRERFCFRVRCACRHRFDQELVVVADIGGTQAIAGPFNMPTGQPKGAPRRNRQRPGRHPDDDTPDRGATEYGSETSPPPASAWMPPQPPQQGQQQQQQQHGALVVVVNVLNATLPVQEIEAHLLVFKQTLAAAGASPVQFMYHVDPQESPEAGCHTAWIVTPFKDVPGALIAKSLWEKHLVNYGVMQLFRSLLTVVTPI
eukprot:m51a1_g12433 hypothetical protein (301) ;mRNA; f:826599-827982